MFADWLVVGAGLTGVTFAERIASQRGERVVVVEQRDHIAGNAFDEYDERGILTHTYGPHLFHTNSSDVFNYLSQFTTWRPYSHKVQAVVEGRLIPLPFNFNSMEALFAPDVAARIISKLIDAFGEGARVPILKLRETDDADLREIADYVYRNVFENYTKKQWGLAPEDLSPTVTARVPVCVSRDDRYFQDKYQTMPANGYTAMVRKMLAHPNIRVVLNTRWQDIKNEMTFKHLLFTGPIDEFFEYRHGTLPYRSLRFETVTHDTERYQQAAVINYPNEFDYTRTSEPKWFTGQKHEATKIIVEYPQAHTVGKNIPYYPVPTESNRAQLRLYEAEAAKLGDTVVFAGRLGDYQYYNMDQAVARALAIVRKLP